MGLGFGETFAVSVSLLEFLQYLGHLSVHKMSHWKDGNAKGSELSQGSYNYIVNIVLNVHRNLEAY